MARVFVDTNVLFPYSLMDLMLTLAEDGIHEFLWSDDLLDEWERVIARAGVRSPESAKAVTAQIRTFFAEGFVSRKDYAHRIGAMPGRDPDDHLHMAAAIAGRASAIITADGRDYPRRDLAKPGIRVQTPDEYLVEVLGELPDETLLAIERMSARRRRPPMTVNEVLDRLSNAGAKRFVIRARDLLAGNELASSDPDSPNAQLNRLDSAQSSPREVIDQIALMSPPPYDARFNISEHVPVGLDSHAQLVEALISKALEAWPPGTTITIGYGNRTYSKMLLYPPDVLTEIGPVTPVQMELAKKFEWFDPASFTARNNDFQSQPVWQNNPVREWDCAVESPDQIGVSIQESAQGVLGVDLSRGYEVTIFNNIPEYWPTPEDSE